MRTSNKILLGGFLAFVLIITGIHAVLYAKIKKGDLVVLGRVPQAPAMEKQQLPAIKYVSVLGFEECHVMYSSNARLELAQGWKNQLEWRVNGDSLVVVPSGERDFANGARVYLPINIYVPEEVIVYSNFSTLYIGGSDDSAKAISRIVSAKNSTVSIEPNLRAGYTANWKKLHVTTHGGFINVSPEVDIAEMDIDLNNSSFTDNGARFDSLLVKTDSHSTISLRQGSLEKLKIIKP